MQFCQVLFLNNYICDIIVLDKIGNRVYNVHRNPQGSLYIYTEGKYTFPPRVFQGILSEYLALKCSPIVVYMDLGYFLVTRYISIRTPYLPPAYPLGIARVFFTKTSRQPKKFWGCCLKFPLS